MEAKDKIRARVGFSPDVGDALALTFAESVPGPDISKLNPLAARRRRAVRPYGWMGV